MATAELNIARERGDAVVALLERAGISPVPAIYGLAYDYVAGADTIGSLRLGTLLASPEPGREQKLYEEFIRPYEPGEALELAIDRTVERLIALDALITERWNVSREHSKSLAAVSHELTRTPPNPMLMREWIARLTAARDQAHKANERLTLELDRVRAEQESAHDEVRNLRRDTLVDPLTGVANRDGLDQALAAAIGAPGAVRNGLAVAVVDVDHFKRFNDTYGHQAGDAVLRRVAQALLATARNNDVVGRMGGDEFIVVLRDTAAAGARTVAEAIRRAVIEGDLSKALGTRVLGNLTASIGIANYAEGDTLATLIARADACLFEAKNTGRNRVAADDLLGTAAAMSKTA